LSARALQRPAHLAGLDRYEPGRPIEEVQRELGLTDVVKLASNENPLGPSPRAVAALTDAMATLHRYPDGPARALRSALAQRLRVTSRHVVVGNGSTDLIDLVARAFLGPEDNAVISEGAFARFRQVVLARNGNARLVPLRDGTHDLEAMARAVDDRTRLLFVALPNNPTGTWNRSAEVDRLLAALPPEVLVVLDQAYFEYAADVPDAEYPDGVDYVRRGHPVVVLRTFSKA
jgi:histidinol-phosphate aminotransferase